MIEDGLRKALIEAGLASVKRFDEQGKLGVEYRSNFEAGVTAFNTVKEYFEENPQVNWDDLWTRLQVDLGDDVDITIVINAIKEFLADKVVVSDGIMMKLMHTWWQSINELTAASDEEEVHSTMVLLQGKAQGIHYAWESLQQALRAADPQPGGE